MVRTVTVGKIDIANDKPFALIAGPCQIESKAHALEMASALKEIGANLGIGVIYKSSFDKANRTSVSTGTPNFSRSSAMIGRLFSMPRPRAALALVRLALSKLVL